MANLNIFDYVFPVSGGTLKKEGNGTTSLILKDIYGTAFHMGGGYFFTAAHVIRSARDNGAIAIFETIDRKLVGHEITECEINSEFDWAIFRANIPRAQSVPWLATELPLLYDVQSTGFPHAVNPDSYIIFTRAFKGYIVSQHDYSQLTGNPRVYELSFQAPRGLSGAPLVTNMGFMAVAGYVIANHATKTLVFSLQETLDDGTRKIIEQHDALQFGIAIEVASILDMSSTILQGTLREHLDKHGLLNMQQQV
jgi:hypothetical protein